jgi:hypothetical protein
MSESPPVPPELAPPPPPERKATPTGTRRVEANPDRPKLRKKTEDRIAPADEKSAQGYDAIERAGEIVDAFKEQIENGAITVQLEVSDTAVHKLKKI